MWPGRDKVDKVRARAPARMPRHEPRFGKVDMRGKADGAPEKRHTLAEQTPLAALDESTTKAFTEGVDETPASPSISSPRQERRPIDTPHPTPHP